MTSEPTEKGAAAGVPRLARVDVIGGAVMIFIAGLIWYGAIGLNLGRIVDMGPGAMPKALALILFVAGAAVLVHGIRQTAREAEPFMVALRPPLIVAIAIILFGLFIRGGEFWFLSTPRLGLMVMGPLTVVIAGLATPDARPKELVVLALGLTAAALLVFPDLLGVPIPVFPTVVERAIPPSFGTDAAVRVLYAAYAGLAGLFALAFFGLPETRRG